MMPLSQKIIRHLAAAKWFMLLLGATLLVSLTACNKKSKKSDKSASEKASATESTQKDTLSESAVGSDIQKSAQRTSNPNTLFRRLSELATGITFENRIKENNFQNILTYSYMYNGGGVAAGDVNNDGLVDLFFTSNQGSNKLYLNRGGMKFQDISESAGITKSRGWHSGVNFCDINGDGWLDIYICRSGPGTNRVQRKNLLLINDGKLQFKDEADSYGVADSNHSTQASFFDYDRDGDLDLYVMNHPVFFGFATVGQVQEKIKDPKVAQANSDNLYQNNGDGTFTKVTEQTGIENLGYGLGLITADLNGDGWTDIYVANDFSTPDFMYINQGNGRFTDEIKSRTRHISYFGMGCDLVDVNCDLNPDIVELDMTAQDRVRSKTLMPSMAPNKFWALVKSLKYQYQYMFNSLQLNQGDGYFSEVAQLAGISKTDWSWAVLGADFDHDGWDDLMVTNGFRRDSKDNDFLSRFRAAKAAAGGRRAMMDKGLMMEWVNQIPSEKLQNYVFKNRGDLTFRNQAKEWGFDDPSFSSGAVYCDLDNDGDQDVVISNIDEVAFVYENRSNELFPNRSFVQVKPVDADGWPVLNAKVQVVANGHTQMKELTTCRGYQSAVDSVLHFGLGETDSIDSITVFWPNETVSVVTSAATGETVKIDNSQARPVDSNSTHARWFSPSRNTIPFRHEENEHNEYENEILLPHSQSSLGPCLATGDVNGDGRDDIFVGGAHQSDAILLEQDQFGEFRYAQAQPWREHSATENVDAVLFDADGDDDLDLYIVNGGGSEFQQNDPNLCDLFFRNNDGELVLDKEAIPQIPSSNGTAVEIDFDSDGDLDLFVGGRLIPGKYPNSAESYLLENNEGKFAKVEMASIKQLGMINDAIATDFDNDGIKDLIAVGEWTEVIFLKNRSGIFEKVAMPGTEDMTGWWFSVTEADVNADGRPDYIVGNLGKNNKFKSKGGAQLKLMCNDFDENGTLDIVLATEVDGRDFPVRGKECSTQQMPILEDKFKTFHEFAMADLGDILGDDKIDAGIRLDVKTFASFVLIRTDDGFSMLELPNMAQISPIRDVLPMDINQDGHLDLITIGNLYNAEVETIRYDAGMGMVLIGDGNGRFLPILSGDSGLRSKTDSRKVARVSTGENSKIIIANNDDLLMMFDVNQPGQNE